MALIKCPECGKEISDQAKSCPGCGKILKKTIGLKMIIIGIISIIISMLILFIFHRQDIQAQAYDINYNQYLIRNIISNILECGGFILFIIGVIVYFVQNKDKLR